MIQIRKRTTETTLEEIKGYSYYLLQDRLDAMLELVKKLDGLVSVPVPMTGTDEVKEDNRPGIYWDNDVWYADIDMNEDNKTFSLYARDRPKEVEIWIAEFTVEEVTPEWVATNLAAFIEK